MSYQAYIDESEKDGQIVLAGHIAKADDWTAFSAEWEPLLRRFGTVRADGVYHFKMLEMMQTPERLDNVQPFYRVIEKYVACSVSLSLRLEDIESAMSRVYAVGHKFDLGDYSNPWLLAFRCLLDMIQSNRTMLDPLIPKESPIDFFFDERSEKKRIAKFWDKYLENRGDLRRLFGQSPVFGSDQDYLPLQAADLWAWSVRRWIENGEIDKIGTVDFGQWEGQRNGDFKAHISFDEDQLFDAFRAQAATSVGKGVQIFDLNKAIFSDVVQS